MRENDIQSSGKRLCNHLDSQRPCDELQPYCTAGTPFTHADYFNMANEALACLRQYNIQETHNVTHTVYMSKNALWTSRHKVSGGYVSHCGSVASWLR